MLHACCISIVTLFIFNRMHHSKEIKYKQSESRPCSEGVSGMH